MSAEMLVSVVVPTFNRLATLARAVESVLRQTHREFELIIVDDASVDGTDAWLRSLNDPRVRYVIRAHRGGPGAARNKGIAKARGSLIAFLDSDDEWLENKLEVQLHVLNEQHDVGLVGCSWSVVRDGAVDETIRPDERMRQSSWLPDAVYDFPFVTSTWLVRRELIERAGLFDEGLPNLEDWELIFRMYGRMGFHVIDEPLVLKHATPSSHDLDKLARLRSFETILTRHGRLWKQYPETLVRHWMELARLRTLAGHPIRGYAARWRARLLHQLATKRWLRSMTPVLGLPRGVHAERMPQSPILERAR